MNFLLSAMTALIAMIALAPQAKASACAIDQYMHNGSLMEIQLCDGGVISISYVRPRPGMARAGARSGSLLFDGVERPGGFITGQSRLFSARCGVVPYAVSGGRQGNTIVLSGTAPIRGQGCRVVRTRQDNLVFSLVGAGAGPGPQVVPAQCPPGFALSGGQCIRVGAGPAPVPQPAPGAGSGDWYAIAGSMRTRGQARSRVNQLGGGAWYIMNTVQCPNFRNGYWIATAGPFSRTQAQSYAASARRYGAYVKTCN